MIKISSGRPTSLFDDKSLRKKIKNTHKKENKKICKYALTNFFFFIFQLTEFEDDACGEIDFDENHEEDFYSNVDESNCVESKKYSAAGVQSCYCLNP